MNAVTSETAIEPVTIKAAGDDQDAQLALLIRQSYADVARRFDHLPFEVLLMRRHLGTVEDGHQTLGSRKKSSCP